MSTYLVVMDRAVPAQSMRYGLLDFVSEHAPAELVLLQLTQRLPGETDDDARRAAEDHAASARSLFSAIGLPVLDAVAGDPLPRKAIASELHAGRRTYEGILLASRPDSLLHLRAGVAHQLERKFGVSVSYVEADAAELAAAR